MVTIVLVIHGFGSTAPNDNAQELFKQTEYCVVAPQLDHSDFESTKDKLESIVEAVLHAPGKLEDFIIVGSSFGGFWAHYLAKKYQVKTILINPALTIKDTCKRCRLNEENTKKYLELSEKYEVNRYTPGIFVDILLGAKDDVIDPRYVMEHFPAFEIMENEGHSIVDKRKLINMIVTANNNLS